jgi:hypothetical protein
MILADSFEPDGAPPQITVESAFDISADKGARVRASRSSDTALMTA